MNFKSWKDAYEFLKEFATCSCLNCQYSSKSDPEKENSEFGYSHVFCVESISMVDLAMMTVCKSWKSEDGKTLEDFAEEKQWKLTDDEIDLLEDGKKRSIDEIYEVLKR